MNWFFLSLGASAVAAICSVIGNVANSKQQEDEIKKEVKLQVEKHFKENDE